MTLGALAAYDVITQASKIDAARKNGFRVLKTEYFFDIDGKTAGEGPIVVGLAANQTAAEIEEAIEADPQGKVDDVENQQAKRPVWPLEIFGSKIGDTNLENESTRKGELTPRWSAPEGDGFSWWAYCLDAGGLTTGCTVVIFAKHYGVWLRD